MLPCRGGLRGKSSRSQSSASQLASSCRGSRISGHERFPRLICGAQRGGFGQESLETAVRAMNRIIFDYEARRKRLKAEAAARGGPQVEEATPRGQLVSFRASARHERMIKEPESAPEDGSSPSVAFQTSLRAYLALPLDQYSLLDPRWITRVGGAGNLFLLRVPLQDVIGLAIEPQITVRVNIDSNNAQVHFVADDFKLGDPRFEKDFVIDMKSTLKRKPLPLLNGFRMPRPWRRAKPEESNTPPARDSHVSDSARVAAQAPRTPIPTPSPAYASNIADNDSFSSSSSSSSDSTVNTPSSTSAESINSSGAFPVVTNYQGLLDGSNAKKIAPSDSSLQHSNETTPQTSSPSFVSISTPEQSDAFTPQAANHTADVAPQSVADSSTPAAATPTPTSPLRPYLDDAATAVATSGPGVAKGGPVVPGATSILCGNVDVGFTVLVPHPLSVVPKPLLFMTASLIARFALQSLLPSFLDLLAVDYSRWAAGNGAARAQPAGSLVVVGSGGSPGVGAAGILTVDGSLDGASGTEGSGSDVDADAEVSRAVAMAAALEAEQSRSSDEEEEGFRNSDRSGNPHEAALTVSEPGMPPLQARQVVMADGTAEEGDAVKDSEIGATKGRFPTRAAMLEAVRSPFRMFSRV